MRKVLTAAVLLLLSGCAGTATRLPSDWQQGTELLPFQTFSSHAGGRGADLVPNGTVARPSWCTAYRDGVTSASYECKVRNPTYSWETSPWVLSAAWPGCAGGGWNGCPNDNRPSQVVQVVAFDARGQAIAWWDGRDGPGTMHATE